MTALFRELITIRHNILFCGRRADFGMKRQADGRTNESLKQCWIGLKVLDWLNNGLWCVKWANRVQVWVILVWWCVS